MNLQNTTLTSKITGFCQLIASKSANFSKIILSAAILMVIGIAAANETFAQNNRSRNDCQSLGFRNTSVNLDGIWKVTFVSGDTEYEAALAIKNQRGASITSYYDSRLERTRRIAQDHIVCQADQDIVIVGYNPTDYDTNQSGSGLSYNADNYVISVRRDGTVNAINVDTAGAVSTIEMEFVKDLPNR